MAAPFLAQLAGGTPVNATPADRAVDQAFALLDGLSVMRLTEFALRQFATETIAMTAVAPATAVIGADGMTVEGVNMPPEYGTGTVSPLGQPRKGSGRLLGGVVLQNLKARMEITGIRGSVSDGRIFAFLKVNDEWVGELPLYVGDPAAVRLSVQLGVPGQPTILRSTNIPIALTQEGVEAFATAFGTSMFTVTDTVFTASGTGNAWPLPASLLPG
jgi:hypothetical protein